MVELLSGPWGPILIFGLRIFDVSLATLRLLFVVRGARLYATVVGFVEILIWVMAAGAVIQNLASPWHVLGYAGGFAAGTTVGMWLESRMALGIATVRAITAGAAGELAAALRATGHGVTEQDARGMSGPVGVLYAVVPRRAIPAVIQMIEARDPDAFVTVQSDATVVRGWLDRSRRV